MGVSKNKGTPKWMVKIMENPVKIDDLGVPLFLETPKLLSQSIIAFQTISFHTCTGTLVHGKGAEIPIGTADISPQ